MRLIQGLSRLMACCMLLTLAVAPVSAQEPKVLHVPRYTQFESLDPPRQADVQSGILVDLLYSKLLTYSYLERPYKLVPELLGRGSKSAIFG